MKDMEFYKLQGAGNDFILIDVRGLSQPVRSLVYKAYARKYCERKVSIGADGVLVIEESKKADFKMRIFNADGSEAEMCGNGARCAALWVDMVRKKRAFPRLRQNPDMLKFETLAGIIKAEVVLKNKSAKVKIRMSAPHDVRRNIPVNILGQKIRVNFINTGVPHTIVFVEGLKSIDVEKIGRAVRVHKQFAPAGTNVDFVEFINERTLKIRTYERGVEGETLACGTGAVASALIAAYHIGLAVVSSKKAVKVNTVSGEVLKVYFDLYNDKIDNVWLEGNAYCVYKGTLCV